MKAEQRKTTAVLTKALGVPDAGDEAMPHLGSGRFKRRDFIPFVSSRFPVRIVVVFPNGQPCAMLLGFLGISAACCNTK